MATPQELAQQIADRSAQAAAMMADLDRRAREAATARLAPTGDTLAMYEDRFNEVYNPANARAVGQANAMREYATGLGDILVRKAREARSGGGGSKYFNPYDSFRIPTLADLIAMVTFGQTPATPTRDALPRLAVPPTAYPPTRPGTQPRSPKYGYGSADTIERRLGR